MGACNPFGYGIIVFNLGFDWPFSVCHILQAAASIRPVVLLARTLKQQQQLITLPFVFGLMVKTKKNKTTQNKNKNKNKTKQN
jgi:hypothetical protein